jgi:hypothetical protein
MPPNSVGPESGSAGVRPESLQGAAPERPAAPEVQPAPGASPAQSAPKLTAADVAAAIAAVPGPAAPVPGATTSAPVPVTASDVDVIEPEWVAKAEEVVTQHQGDPYGEEEAVEDLQRDYLQKRYGHTVGDPKGDNSKPEGT